MKDNDRRIGIGGTAIMAGTLLFGASCSADVKPTIGPVLGPPAPQPSETARDFGPITEADITNASRQVAKDFNNLLGFTIDENNLAQRVSLVTSLSEYQDIIARNSTGYIPEDEINRPAITSNTEGHIYLYSGSVESVTEGFDHTAKVDFIELTLSHEMVHFTANSYRSNELHSLIYGRLEDKNIEQDVVSGAEVKAVVDGVRKSTFESLEEAEAVVISDFIVRNRGRLQIVRTFSPDDLGIRPQVDLLYTLLLDLGDGNADEPLKKLALFRTQEGGREEWCKYIADHFGIPQEDSLLFAMLVLDSINSGNVEEYQRLTTLNP